MTSRELLLKQRLNAVSYTHLDVYKRQRKNKLMSGGNDVNETIEAEGNLQDVI